MSYSGDNSYRRNFLTVRKIYRKPGQLYLTRYVIFRCKWFGIYVHYFHQSDDPIVHDHPWNFLSIPLTAGYREHLPDGTVVYRKPFHPKIRSAEEFHWIERILGKGDLWTLFLRGRARRNWGFLTKEGWVPHEEYHRKLWL